MLMASTWEIHRSNTVAIPDQYPRPSREGRQRDGLNSVLLIMSESCRSRFLLLILPRSTLPSPRQEQCRLASVAAARDAKAIPFASFACLAGLDRPLFRDVQDRIDELADVLQAGNGVEASAAGVADEELGAIREDGYGMGAERQVHAHAEGGIVVAQRLLKFLEVGNRFPEQLRVIAPPRFHEAPSKAT
jgi:hypothetical protein